MSSGVQKLIRDDDTVMEVSGELEYKTVKDVEVPQNVNPMPRSPPPFPKKFIRKDRGWAFYNDVEITFYQCLFGRKS